MLCLVEVKRRNDRKWERENRCFPLIGGGEGNWWVGDFAPIPTKYNLSQNREKKKREKGCKVKKKLLLLLSPYFKLQ